METARQRFYIYHVILIVLGRELNPHLPLQCTILTPTHSRDNLSGPMRDTPPYRVPFRDIAEGAIPTICLVFMWYRASSAEIPLLWGGIAPPLGMLSKGETLRKGGGGIAPNWPC